MDLRNLPNHLSAHERCETRRRQIEQECDFSLSALSVDPEKIGHAEERNCEQMFGHVPIPVGYAGPLPTTFSSGETADIHLPLATTEGALVASVNRGCKALRLSGGVQTQSTYHGVSRSIALKFPISKAQFPNNLQSPIRPPVQGPTLRPRAQSRVGTLQGLERRAHGREAISKIRARENEWKTVGAATSNHLKILKYEIDTKDDCIFLTIYADTDEAMGMNMVTIAAEAIGKWFAENLNVELVTVAANVDSDKKPSRRTHDRGRGYEVTATAIIPTDVVISVLKTTPEALLSVAHAKLDIGSDIAGAIGHNCHAANIIAALYIATGQDPAHVVEGALSDTTITRYSLLVTRKNNQERANEPTSNDMSDSLMISTRIPSLMIGIRGGGTTLPAQHQCLNLLLTAKSYKLKTPQRLAESIGAAVLAGELSLLAALASDHLAKSHAALARTGKS